MSLFLLMGLTISAQTTVVVTNQETVNGQTVALADGSGSVAYTNADNAIWYLGTFNLAQLSSIEVQGAAFVSRSSNGAKAQLRIAAVAPGSLPMVNTTTLGALSGTIRATGSELCRIVAETTPTTIATGKNATNYAGANFSVTATGVTQLGTYDGNVVLEADSSKAINKNTGIYQLFVYGNASSRRLAINKIIMHYQGEGASSLNSIVTPTADTYVRLGNTTNFGTKPTMEVHSAYTGTTYTSDFVGLMAFNIPSAALGHITSANLRLVTNMCKGSTAMNLRTYNNAFAEGTIYANETSYINQARQTTPVTFNVALGRRTFSLSADDITGYNDLSLWTNNVDVTSLLQLAQSSSVQLMLEVATSNDLKNEFFTKDATDVINAKNTSYTYAAADLVPQLTITYTSGTTVNTYTVSMTDAQAATLTLPFDAKLPDGVKAYTLNYTSGATSVGTTEVVGTLAANTPILVNAPVGDYPFAAINAVASPEIQQSSTVGALTGVYAETVVPEGSYVLQNQDGVVAFYQVTVGSNILAPAYCAYLTADATAPSKLSLNLGDVTAIKGVSTQANGNADAIYNLSGQRVDSSYQGIIIKNGKKYLNR